VNDTGTAAPTADPKGTAGPTTPPAKVTTGPTDSPDPGDEQPTATPQAPAPMVYITRGDILPIVPGAPFLLDVIFENKGQVAVEMPLASFAPGEGLLLEERSASVLLERIEPGESYQMRLHLRAAEALTVPQLSVEVTLKHEYTVAEQVGQATVTEKLLLPTAVKANEVKSASMFIGRADFPTLIEADATREVVVWFKNTGNVELKNLVASYSPSEGILLQGSSSSTAIGDLAPGEVKSVALAVLGNREITSAQQSIQVDAKYEYVTDKTPQQGTVNEKILLPAAIKVKSAGGGGGGGGKKPRPDISVPNIIISSYNFGAEQVAAGAEFPLTIRFKNTSAIVEVEIIVMSMEASEGLTIINVSPPPANVKSVPAMDAKLLSTFRQIPGVVFATPKLTADDITIRVVAGKDKRFVCDFATVVGMQRDAPEKLSYKLLAGGQLTERKGSVLLGQNFAYMFRDTKRPEGHNRVDTSSLYMDDGEQTDKPKPYFDPMQMPLELVVETTVNGKTQTKAYPLKPEGIMKEDYAKGGETADGLLLYDEELNRILKEARRGTEAANRRTKGYPQVIVKVAGIAQVAEAESQIKQMGYVTSSMESIRKPMEKEAQEKQMMLGGLGAISLLVAALGITNTMIMSISERTREIGIMKALGCKIDDIRTLFLLEAGSIGLIGGFAAIAASLLISSILNVVQSKQTLESLDQLMQILSTPGSRMSVVPLWLVGFSLIFSVFIGLFSGFHPANKAVRIPALEAIKSE